MSYIGKSPSIGNFQKCDSISVVNGQATYGLTVNSTAVFPESANHVLCSLNGILQAPTDSFTVSGSTLTFASNLSTGDVIDFVMILGNVLDLGVPSDNTVTASKLNNDIISGQTALTSEPADTDEFLVSDAGTIKRIDYSLIKGGGITEADIFRLTADLGASFNAYITSNLERVDDATFSKIGTGMSQTSGVFTFPTTGLYQVEYIINGYESGGTETLSIEASSDSGTNYDEIAFAYDGDNDGYYSQAYLSSFVNVTNASNFRVRFRATTQASGNIYGNTNRNHTYMKFIRLGDSQ